MKSLVVFYSKTGNTRCVGKEIAKILNSDVDEIVDKKGKEGILGFISAGFRAFSKKLTEIEYKKNPNDYGIIAIGTPIWAGKLTPAVRTYLTKNKPRKVAFFCTCSTKQAKVFGEMEKLSSKPIATLQLIDKKIKKSGKEIKEFCDKLVL